MALNLLDSLSTTAAPTEKNSFSLKNKESPVDGAMEFGQLFGAMMNPAQALALASTQGLTEPTGEKDAAAGQKIAMQNSDTALTDPSAALLAGAITPTVSLAVPAPASAATPLEVSVKDSVTAPVLASGKRPVLASGTTPTPGLSAVTASTSSVPSTPTPPAPPQLTAVVLSRNMTAITPSQAAPDGDSLVAFAKSQGLDEAVAAWLFAAGKASAPKPAVGPSDTTAATPLGAPDPTAASEQATALDDPALANVALAIRLLASPTQAAAQAQPGSTPADAAPTPVQLMPMATPAAWLSTRPTAASKAGQATPTLPQTSSGKTDTHTSDLDLTLIFGDGKDPVKTAPLPPASFTPAAWVMAGLAGGAGQAEQNSALLSASSLVKSLSIEPQADDGSAQVNSLNPGGAERSPGKLSEPLSGTTAAKGSEFSMTTAERSELHQGQAEKMGQAIGLRMLSEMEKGHWHLKMMLKPANLGNIEVEMRMRHGELDANFTASQAATRDLLQDGLPKLKDTLNQMGMDVASMNIGGGSNPKNGGDPTPQQTPTVTPAAKIEQKEESTTIERAQITPSSQDGLDVLV